MDYREEIEKLKKEKNAVVMCHYYNSGDLQDVADMVGDSLSLARYAAEASADVIAVVGVNFMAETAKMLSPQKKVLVPDDNAGCSLADSCRESEFKAFLAEHPGHIVISYVNTSAEIKALTDVVVTSSNAKKIVESFPADEKIIFGPDYNLGQYINKITGRNMLLWRGGCCVHEAFKAEKLAEYKKLYPEALVLTHPECKEDVVELSDYVGSTSGIINFAAKSAAKEFIIVTEHGVIHQMERLCPGKKLIPLPTATAPRNTCRSMRLNTMEKLYLCLRDEKPEITLSQDLIEKGMKPIRRMLELS